MITAERVQTILSIVEARAYDFASMPQEFNVKWCRITSENSCKQGYRGRKRMSILYYKSDI